jgi:hypothetical protein
VVAGGQAIFNIGKVGYAAYVLYDPARPQAEHEAALASIADCMLKVRRAKDSIAAGALSIKSTTTGSLALGAAATAAGLLIAYCDFAESLVEWAEDWEALQDAQELQFTGWHDPAAAAREARGDKQRAVRLLDGAGEMHGKAVRANSANYDLLKDEEARLQKRKAAASRDVTDGDRGTALEMAQAELERGQAAYDEIAKAQKATEGNERDAMECIGRAVAMVGLATHKERCVAVFESELKKAIDAGGKQTDPSGRMVTLEEIRTFATSQKVKTLRRDKMRTFAALLGVAAGIQILMFGWTPVGWGLVLAAGAAGAAILLYKGGGLLLQKFRGTLSPREVYARRLWNYARSGYDVGQAASPPVDVRQRNRADAIALLRALGVSWSEKDIAAAKPDDAIGAIENAMKW